VTYLVDTNVASEERRPNADPNVRAWWASVDETQVFLSVLLIGEARRGIERLRRRDPAQAAVLDEWLARLRRHAADRILPITGEIADEWGRLNVPDPLPPIDGLLAATARVRGLILVTRNTADFERSGVRLLNPFEPR
jgi:predicted nucleic acid-binding protein